MGLLQKLADDKPVVSTRRDDKPKFTIMRKEKVPGDKNSLKNGDPESKKLVRTLVENIPQGILKQTTLRRKKMSYREEAEELGPHQESGKRLPNEQEGEDEFFPGRKMVEDSAESQSEQESLCTILAEEKRRNQDSELQTDPSSGTYNLDNHDMTREKNW